MYKDFNKEENLFVDILRKQYDEVVLTEQPDFLFYGPFGIDHHKFNNFITITESNSPYGDVTRRYFSDDAL